MTKTAVREAPTPEQAYAGAPGLRAEFTFLMDLMPDALAGRLATPRLREYLLRRAAIKDRTALIAVLSDADQEFALAAAEVAETAAKVLWEHDELHAQDQGLGNLPPGPGPAVGGPREYVRRHYLQWATAGPSAL
jgi:hypothetical protein